LEPDSDVLEPDSDVLEPDSDVSLQIEENKTVAAKDKTATKINHDRNINEYSPPSPKLQEKIEKIQDSKITTKSKRNEKITAVSSKNELAANKITNLIIQPDNFSLPIEVLATFGFETSEISSLSRQGYIRIIDFFKTSFFANNEAKYEIIRKGLSKPYVQIIKDFIKLPAMEKTYSAIYYNYLHRSEEDISKILQIPINQIKQQVAIGIDCLKMISDDLKVKIIQKNKNAIITFNDVRQFFDNDDYISSIFMYCLNLKPSKNNVSFMSVFKDSQERITKKPSTLKTQEISKPIIEEIEKPIHKEAFPNENNHEQVSTFFNSKSLESFDNGLNQIICDYFPRGIKIFNDSHLSVLKEKLQKDYPGLEISITSNNLRKECLSRLLLWDQGTYQSINSINYKKKLIEDIVEFIVGSHQKSFLYSEIFHFFKGRLQFESNIQNPHALHGLLKYLYKNDFRFESDQLVKLGEEKESLEDKIKNLIAKNGYKPISAKEIMICNPAIKMSMIYNLARTSDKLFKFGEGSFFHVDFLHFEDSILNELKSITDQEINSNKGFASMECIFNNCFETLGNALSENYITNAYELFTFLQYKFINDYIFSRPNIFSKEMREPSLKGILKLLLGSKSFSLSDINKLTKKYKWNKLTVTNTINELQADGYLRISTDDFIHLSIFQNLEIPTKEIQKKLNSLVPSTGYLLTSAIASFEKFPIFQYAWNSYLLESILRIKQIGYTFIPVERTHSIQGFSIIIKTEISADIYEDLVIYVMNSQNITSLSKEEMSDFLLDNGLSESNIPHELNIGKRIEFNNDYYTLRD
jgi:hypothetical protein